MHVNNAVVVGGHGCGVGGCRRCDGHTMMVRSADVDVVLWHGRREGIDGD